MKQIVCLFGLLCAVALPFYAQNWTPQDSLRLQQMLKAGGEVKLNPEVLKELETHGPLGAPKAAINKSWMNFDNTMPMMPKMPEKKVVLTLRPYTANTKYNWDPVYQKKIVVKENTWRDEPFLGVTGLFIYSNWAKKPFDAGPRETLEQIEATGLRYRMGERVNNMAVGRWEKAEGNGSFSGDFMLPFTREFWDFKGKKRRARTLEVLRAYGDSTTVLIKQPVKAITDK